MRNRQDRIRESVFDIGDMQDQILIQRPVKISNGQGGNIINWTDYATVWAGVESLSDNWKTQQNSKTTSDLKDFIVRYDSNIKKNMRIVWNDTSYLITGIFDYNARGYYLRIKCEGNKIDGV